MTNSTDIELMTELSQVLPVPGIDVAHRCCATCGERMSIVYRAPGSPSQKNWRWKCHPCTNAGARRAHQSPARQEAKRQYREQNRDVIAERKSEWGKTDRALNPEKYKERARASHQALMADETRKRRKYDKGNEKARLDLAKLKENPAAYEAHLQAERKRRKERYGRNLESTLLSSKRSHYKTKYGLELEELAALWEEQGRACRICRTELSDPAGEREKHRSGTWHLDHCHDTGAIRGLLCNRCNMGLGLFKDDPLLLQQAIAYLNGGNRSLVDAVLHSVDERHRDGAA